MRWIDNPLEGAGALPVTLVVRSTSPGERRTHLRSFVASALALDPARVGIEHREGRPPAVVRPEGSGLRLSTASRAGLAAMTVAAAPVGVDLELVDPTADIPWRVLHPAEAAMLRSGGSEAKAEAFCRLWSVKEAYLKALGLGLSREPSSFAVHFTGPDVAVVEDPLGPAGTADARTLWRRGAGTVPAAISTVLLRP